MTADIEGRLFGLTSPVRERMGGLFDGKRKPWEVYGLLSEFLASPGKLLRPALCLLCCEAVGGKPKDAVPAATAIEMFHNFTLIHDDIEDGSQLRRGAPCMHVKYGLPLALNAGDGLFMMVWQEALLLRGEAGLAAQKLLLTAFTRVLEGQAVELGWYQSGKWDVNREEYWQVVSGKTGALIAAACEVGGLLGGGDAKTCAALREFGEGVGVGFQMVDDVLNIVGDVKKYGKEIGGDVREGKRTLITIYARELLPAAKAARLSALLQKKSKSEKDVLAAVELLQQSGAPQKVLSEADELIGKALGKLAVLPKGRPRLELEAAAEYIVRRKR